MSFWAISGSVSELDGWYLDGAEGYLVLAVCAIFVVAFIIATLMTGYSGEIFVVAQQVGQWIELRIGHDGPLALLGVQHLRGGCGQDFADRRGMNCTVLWEAFINSLRSYNKYTFQSICCCAVIGQL